MPISKDRISSPLEAGASLRESQKLPLHIVDALETVSERLMKKRLHLTLFVLPHNISKENQRPSPSVTPTSSTSLSAVGSLLFSKTHWPLRAHPVRLATSNTRHINPPVSPRSLTSHGSLSALSTSFDVTNPCGITLLHATTLAEKVSRTLNEAVAKACKKHRFASDTLLSAPNPPALPAELIRTSIEQNDILFSSEGLTLLSFDRLYSFKLALHACSDPDIGKQHEALTAAVNELRLLVLLHNSRRISTSYISRTYSYIVIPDSVLHTVNSAYKSAYNVDGLALVIPGETTKDKGMHEEKSVETVMAAEDREIQVGEDARGVVKARTTDVGEDTMWFVKNREIEVGEDAKGVEIVRLSQWQPQRSRGPITPKTYADITPITRGSWGAFMRGRDDVNMAAVETCN